MDLITANPYRTLGVFCGASAREIQKQLAKVKAFSRVGKQSKLETDFDFLGGVSRDEQQIVEAASKIEQAKYKVFYSIFWFEKSNHIDETALSYLAKNETDKAIDIWNKIISSADGQVNKKNFSAFLNLSTLLIEDGFQNNEASKIVQGIKIKGQLITSDQFGDFVRNVAGENIVLNHELVASEISNEILAIIKKRKLKLKFEDLIESFSSFPAEIVERIKEKYTEKPFQTIENEIEFASVKREDFPENADKYGEELYKNTKAELQFLAKTLGKTNIQVKSLASKLANEILQCSIDYFNEMQDSEADPGETAVRIAKLAKSVCPPGATLNRIKENLEIIEEWVEDSPERQRQGKVAEDLAFITAKLKRFQNLQASVSNAKDLIDSCKPRLQNMKLALGSSDEFYMKISSAVVGNAQGMLVAAVNEAQEGYKENQSFSIPGVETYFEDGIMKTRYKKTITLSVLATIINEAYTVTLSMDSMDMDSNLRQQYVGNKGTISSIRSQINSALGVRSPRPTQTSSTRSTTVRSTSTTESGEGKQILLLLLSIVIWILTFTIDDGTVFSAIVYGSFVLFAMWYAPVAIFRLIKNAIKNN